MKRQIVKPSTVATLASAREFAAFEEEWEGLYGNSLSATPFQSLAWFYSWWECYGGGYELCLITVRSEDSLLVGVTSFMLERRGVIMRLIFIGTGVTEHLDALTREGWEDEVAGARALGRGRVKSAVARYRALRIRAMQYGKKHS